MEDIPAGPAVIDIGQIGTRLVVLHADGSLAVGGVAGGYLPVPAPDELDTEHPPRLRVLGSEVYSIITLGQGASLQVLGNLVEPLPEELKHALPLDVWSTKDGDAEAIRVLISTEAGLQVWEVAEL